MGWQKQPGPTGDHSHMARWEPSTRLDWAFSAAALGMTRPRLDAVVTDFKSFSVSFKMLHWCTGDNPVWKSLFASGLSTFYQQSLQQGLLSPPPNQSPAAIYDVTFLYKEYVLCLLVVTFTINHYAWLSILACFSYLTFCGGIAYVIASILLMW